MVMDSSEKTKENKVKVKNNVSPIILIFLFIFFLQGFKIGAR
jgi:hypothetical protein